MLESVRVSVGSSVSGSPLVTPTTSVPPYFAPSRLPAEAGPSTTSANTETSAAATGTELDAEALRLRRRSSEIQAFCLRLRLWARLAAW